ncbi:MAG: hypothetical protein HZY75_02765 [Nocardioidaceae bacterium]|nr:MAG: hypothetical protein HZY75_02765 [Nocardioidaceae bacterium]
MAVTTGILVLVAGAYALGSVLTGDGVDTPDAVTPRRPGPLDQESAAKPDDGSEAKPQQDPQSNAQPDKKDRDEPAESQKTPDSKQRPGAQQPWKGSVATLEPTRAKAGCVYPPSVDAAGKKVHYRPSEAIDADPATAWRCAGRGAGQSLTIKLGEMVRIAEVGLVAGYAKTDPSDGTDRYAENNRITKVRWSFDSGESFVQRLDPSPKKRGLQLIRIPVVKSENVTITILGSARGPRNTVAISEVSLARVTKAG